MAESEAYERILRQKAKENQVVRKGEQAGATLQNSAELINPIDTKKKLLDCINYCMFQIVKLRRIKTVTLQLQGINKQ